VISCFLILTDNVIVVVCQVNVRKQHDSTWMNISHSLFSTVSAFLESVPDSKASFTHYECRCNIFSYFPWKVDRTFNWLSHSYFWNGYKSDSIFALYDRLPYQ